MAARELPVLPLAASSASSSDALQPLEPFVLAPTQSHSGDSKLRDRVTGVAIATAVYFAASALIQVLCGLINEKRLENNLRALAQVEAVPELLWLVDALPSFILLSAVPILIISFVTGCLFATCGIMGAKANSECCACCYCCCNASYCLFLVVMLGLAGAFLHNMSLASGMAQLWFARCDPKICYPLGYDTNPQTTIDCLAPAVWDEYRPQLDIDHLPQECPPMYLECGESSISQDVVEERFLQEVDDDDEREEPREEAEEEASATEEREEPREEAEEEEEATTTEEREEPREEAEEEEATTTEEREEPREEAEEEEEATTTEEISPADSAADSDPSMAPDAVEGARGGDGVLELQQPEPAEEVEEAEEPEEEEEVENPAQGTEKDRDNGEEEDGNEDGNEELQDAFVDSSYDRSESPLKALAESNEILGKVLAVPMPEDPVKECQPSKIVALYKVASKEAPAVFDAVWKQGLLRLICILPGLLLMSLGFWWGHEHWTKLTSKTGEATPYVLGLPFGETNSADVQMTHMSQPLMTQQ